MADLSRIVILHIDGEHTQMGTEERDDRGSMGVMPKTEKYEEVP